MQLRLIIVITTHSHFGRERNVLLFYSFSIIEFTYCMYIIVNKATFIVAETIMVIIKNSITPINTTSLSDSKAILVQLQHISTTIAPFNFIKNLTKYMKNILK